MLSLIEEECSSTQVGDCWTPGHPHPLVALASGGRWSFHSYLMPTPAHHSQSLPKLDTRCRRSIRMCSKSMQISQEQELVPPKSGSMFSPMFKTAFQDATPSLLLDPSAFETGHPLWHGQTSARSSTFGKLISYIKNPKRIYRPMDVYGMT